MVNIVGGLLLINGYAFEYGDEIRALLHRFATDEA
jgi:death on curing protein